MGVPCNDTLMSHRMIPSVFLPLYGTLRESVLHILTSVRAPLAEDFDFQAKLLARNVKEIKTFLMVFQACLYDVWGLRYLKFQV